MNLTVKQLILVTLLLCLAPLSFAFAQDSCAGEAKGLTDMRFTGAYEKSKMVIDLKEMADTKQMTAEISRKKNIGAAEMNRLRAILIEADAARKSLWKDTQSRRSDFFRAAYRRCAGQPQMATDDQEVMSLSLRPDPTYQAPSKVKRAPSTPPTKVRIRLKRTTASVK